MNIRQIDIVLNLSQHMMTDCLLIYGFLLVLVCCDLKIVLQIYKIILIIVNPGKSSEISKQYHVRSSDHGLHNEIVILSDER